MAGDEPSFSVAQRVLCIIQNRYQAIIELGLLDRFGHVGGEPDILHPCGITAHADRGRHYHCHRVAQNWVSLDPLPKRFPVGFRHLHIKNGDTERISIFNGLPQHLDRLICA